MIQTNETKVKFGTWFKCPSTSFMPAFHSLAETYLYATPSSDVVKSFNDLTDEGEKESALNAFIDDGAVSMVGKIEGCMSVTDIVPGCYFLILDEGGFGSDNTFTVLM